MVVEIRQGEDRRSCGVVVLGLEIRVSYRPLQNTVNAVNKAVKPAQKSGAESGKIDQLD
jgi:hypothetical protein